MKKKGFGAASTRIGCAGEVVVRIRVDISCCMMAAGAETCQTSSLAPAYMEYCSVAVVLGSSTWSS